MKEHTSEQKTLLEQLAQVAHGLSETFAPFCEVVVHDLTNPKRAIMAIHNNLSGREKGQPATQLGLSRISDPNFPQVIANYANRFGDGRQAKSTSIGIKDSSGRYVAALCLNIDLTMFLGLQSALGQFVSSEANAAVRESLDPTGAGAIRAYIDRFAAKYATTPRALKAEERRLLMRELKTEGILRVRRSMEIVAEHLGVSRASVYSYAK